MFCIIMSIKLIQIFLKYLYQAILFCARICKAGFLCRKSGDFGQNPVKNGRFLRLANSNMTEVMFRPVNILCLTRKKAGENHNLT